MPASTSSSGGSASADDPQPGRGVGRRPTSSAPKSADDRRASAGSDSSRERDTDRAAEPHAVDPEADRAGEVAGAEAAGDRAGRAVGQEDAEVDDGGEHRGADAERGERRGAEPADDDGVAEQEQRLGHEREERGDREAQDLAVLRPAPQALRHPRPRATRHRGARDRCASMPAPVTLRTADASRSAARFGSVGDGCGTRRSDVRVPRSTATGDELSLNRGGRRLRRSGPRAVGRRPQFTRLSTGLSTTDHASFAELSTEPPTGRLDGAAHRRPETVGRRRRRPRRRRTAACSQPPHRGAS